MTAAEDDRLRLAEALIRTGAEDRTAFLEVHRLTAAKLFGICLRICGERHAAEDVLHEVYLTVWKRAGAYEPGRASPITWLATIARNRAIDWRRAHNDSQSGGAIWPSEGAMVLPDTAPLADEMLETREQTYELRKCLEQLEERQRDAIRTAFFDGITYTELAERASVPLGTMKSWVRRGLGKLRNCLER